MVRIKYGRNAAKATTADAEPEPTAGPSDTISNGAPPPTEPAAADAQHATTQATTAPPKRPKGRPRKNPAPVVATTDDSQDFEPSSTQLRAVASTVPDTELNVNQRPRRQVRHKFIKHVAYTGGDGSGGSLNNTATTDDGESCSIFYDDGDGDDASKSSNASDTARIMLELQMQEQQQLEEDVNHVATTSTTTSEESTDVPKAADTADQIDALPAEETPTTPMPVTATVVAKRGRGRPRLQPILLPIEVVPDDSYADEDGNNSNSSTPPSSYQDVFAQSLPKLQSSTAKAVAAVRTAALAAAAAANLANSSSASIDVSTPIAEGHAVVVKRGRGRPRKVRDQPPPAPLPPATPTTPQPPRRSVDIISIGDATVEIVEEPVDGVAEHLVETCTIDSEQFELLEVEDDDLDGPQTDVEESLSEFTLGSQSATDTANETADEETEFPDQLQVIGHEQNPDGRRYVIDFPARLLGEPEQQHNDSHDSSFLSDELTGFDGDGAPVTKNGRSGANTSAAVRRISPLAGAAAVGAVDVASVLDVAQRQMKALKTAKRRSKEGGAGVHKPAARVTRRNSILFTPTATPSNVTALVKLLRTSPGETAQLKRMLLDGTLPASMRLEDARRMAMEAATAAAATEAEAADDQQSTDDVRVIVVDDDSRSTVSPHIGNATSAVLENGDSESAVAEIATAEAESLPEPVPSPVEELAVETAASTQPTTPPPAPPDTNVQPPTATATVDSILPPPPPPTPPAKPPATKDKDAHRSSSSSSHSHSSSHKSSSHSSRHSSSHHHSGGHKSSSSSSSRDKSKHSTHSSSSSHSKRHSSSKPSHSSSGHESSSRKPSSSSSSSSSARKSTAATATAIESGSVESVDKSQPSPQSNKQSTTSSSDSRKSTNISATPTSSDASKMPSPAVLDAPKTTPATPNLPAPAPIIVDVSAALSAKRAARTKRLESICRPLEPPRKAVPTVKLDPYKIISDCYMPKQVKHDASLYSIEVMRANRAKLEAEAAAAAAEAEEAKRRLLKVETPQPAQSQIASDPAMASIVQQPPPPGVVEPEEEENWDDVVETKPAANNDVVVRVKDEPTVADVDAEMKDECPAEVKLEEQLATPEPEPSSSANEAAATLPPTAPPADNPTPATATEEEPTNIRRSGRIKIISETKQRSSGTGLVRNRGRIHTTMVGLVDGGQSGHSNVSPTTLSPAPDASPTDANASSLSCSSGVSSMSSSSTSLDCGLSTSSSQSATSDVPDRVGAEPPKTIVPTTYEASLSGAELERHQRDVREGLALFKPIADNEFRSERNVSKEARRMQCDCFLTAAEVARGELGCGEDCLNRLLMIECGSRCAVGERCTNKRFQLHQNSPCTIFKTDKKGFGLLANANIAAGDFLMEYVGEVLDGQQFERRAAEYAQEKNRHHYFMALRSDCVIDATLRGNISRFINHSCDPNAETQKWTVNGELRIGFFSTRAIAAGQEVTFDYQFQRYGKAAQRCYCEADCCRGWIGEEPDTDEEIEDESSDGDEADEEDETVSAQPSAVTSSPIAIDTETNADATLPPTDVKKKPVVRGRPRKQPAIAASADAKAKKPTKPKRAEIMDDLDLDMQIGQLERSQLKNQTQTLAFSRLMVRAKLTDAKLRLLRILCSGELACRRLFLDYHGLKLLHAWLDVDGAGNAIQAPEAAGDLGEEGQPKAPVNRNAAWELRLEILQTLAVLPIPNKHQLEDSKMLSTVGKWTELSALHPVTAVAGTSEIKADVKKELSTSPTPSNVEATMAVVDSIAGSDVPGDLPQLLESDASALCIPDINVDALKQIISSASANEEAKRTDADESADTSAPKDITVVVVADDDEKPATTTTADPVTSDSVAAPDDSQRLLTAIVTLAKELVASWSQLPEVFRIPKRQRIEQMKEHEREANRNYRALTTAGDDAQAQARKNVERFRERERPVDNSPNTSAGGAVKTLTPLRFRSPMTAANQTANTSVFSSPLSGGGSEAGHGLNGSPTATTPASSSTPDVSMSKMLRRQQFEAKVAAERQQAEKQHMHETKCAFFRLPAQQTAETAVPFCVNPYTSQWYGLYGHPVATPPSHMHIKPPQQKLSTNPADYELPPMDLPKYWTYGIDEAGHVYYYHLKIRIPQWVPPIRLEPLDSSWKSAGSAASNSLSAAAGGGESSDTDAEDEVDADLMRRVLTLEQAIANKRKHLELLQQLPKDGARDPEQLVINAAALLEAGSTRVESIVPFKRRRKRPTLAQERCISPRTDAELKSAKQEMRRYRENKEKLKIRKSDAKKRRRDRDAAAASAAANAEVGVEHDNDDDDDDDDDEEEDDVDTNGDATLAQVVNGHIDPDGVDGVVGVNDEEDSDNEPDAEQTASEAGPSATNAAKKRSLNAADGAEQLRAEALRRAAAAKRKRLDEQPAAHTSATQPPQPVEPPTASTPADSPSSGGEAAAAAKRIRDKFRANIYGVVEQNLLYYRRKGCSVGYISSDDDLRHLSKKLAHFVFVKELSHCNNRLEALDVSDSVRTKTRDFVRKYMQKFGATYRRTEPTTTTAAGGAEAPPQ